MKISGPRYATLTGLATGDALGMPFETAHYRDDRLVTWQGDFLASEYHGLEPGQWTDDTVMAKCLAESLVTHGVYAPADAAKRYAAWYDLGVPERRGMGKTTEKALNKLAHGIPWTQTGDPDSLGNGAAMRAAPLGLMYRDNIQAAAEMARIDAHITHRHPEAVNGAVAVAVGVAALVQGRVQPYNLIQAVSEWVPEGSKMFMKLQQAKAMTQRALPKAGPNIMPATQLLIEVGTAANVLESVPAAFLAVAATKSYREAIETAVRAGGDTDTIAAIAGALAGTHYGFQEVARFVDQVEAAAELRALEQNLHRAAPPMYQVR